MAFEITTFKLDMTPGKIPAVVNVSQGDIGRTFVVDTYWNGKRWDAYGTPILRGKKPDGTVFEYNVDYNDDDYVEFSTTEQMTIIPGPVACELVFSQGGTTVATANFILKVEDAPYDPDALSESDVQTLGELIEQTIGGDIRDEVDNLVTQNPELMLQDNAVTTPKLASGAVTEGKIASNAVTTGKLATGAVTTAKVDADFLKTIENAYVTPEQFGAVGDGTTDDTAAVQAAISAGDFVVFSNKYKLTGRVSLRSNSRLLGVGDALLTWGTFSGETSIIGSQNLDNLTIEGISFDFGSQTELRYSLSLLDSTNCNIINCSFKNGYGYALRINNNANAKISGCNFSDITGATGNPGGAIFGSDFHDVTITGCTCSNIGDHFAYLAGSVEIYNVTISDCICNTTGANDLTNGCAITIYANCHNITVSNCDFKLCKGGIYCGQYGSYTTIPHEVTISNCNFLSTTNGALEFIGLSSASMYCIDINNITVNTTSADAFILRNINFINVSNVVINSPYRYGIELSKVIYGTFSNVTITGIRSTALLVGLNDAASFNKFVNVNCLARSGTPSGSQGLYNRSGTNNEYINVFASGFATNYIKGGANNVYINSQADRKSIMFTSDITEAIYHNVGDVVLNAAPAVGSPFGWVCTVAGSPGTMTPIVTL